MDSTFDDGFSIRNYTSKIRSIDVFKCWPFPSTTHLTRHQLHSLLPPLSPTPPPPPPADDPKFNLLCPVCRHFNAATLTAVNAHIDACLANSVQQQQNHPHIIITSKPSSKSKSPKKRSIAEIFKLNDDNLKIQEEKSLQCSENMNIEDDEVSITVRKFRWLSQRLEALRSKGGGGESAKSLVEEEKLEMICPVCRDFNAATVTAVNAHIDSCLAMAVRDEKRQMIKVGFKSKTKVTKKRSIAEILTVAPPIEVGKSKKVDVEVEEDDDEDKTSDYSGEDSSSNSDAAATFDSMKKKKKSVNKNSKKKKTKKMKKTKKKMMIKSMNNEKKKIVNMMKKKKKKKNIFNSEITGKKESAYKLGVQTAVNSRRKIRGTVGDEMDSLQDIEPSVHRKKLCLNGLSVKKRQKPDSPVRGIFKNHSKHVSGKISDGCKIPDGTKESHVNDQVLTPDRHVEFSYKDEIVGSKKINSFNETMFNISSDEENSSLCVKEQFSGTDEESSSFESNRNYDHIALNINKGKKEEDYERKQFSTTKEQVTEPNFLKPCINQEKSNQLEQKSELLTKMEDYDNNNSHLFYGGNRTTTDFSPNASNSESLLAVQEGKVCGKNTQASDFGIFSSGGKFIDYSEGPTFQVDAGNKNASTKTFPEPSSSYSAPYDKVNENPESPSPSSSYYGDNGNSDQALGDRELYNMFPADMSDKSYPFTSWGQGCIRNSCMDPNFYGLPLNSHGELINFSSSGNVGTSQLESSSSLGGSLSGLPSNNILCQSSQESLGVNERHVVQKTSQKDSLNSLPHYPPRLAVTESCSPREDVHPPNSELSSSHHVQPLQSEYLKHSLCVEQTQCERVQNHNRNGMVSLKEGSEHFSLSSSQPTVRLMGKDVPIARSSQETQKFTADVWTDEESRGRHCAEYTALESSLLGRYSKQDLVSGPSLQISAGSVLQSEKIQSTHGLQSTQGFPQQFIDMESNDAPQNGSFGAGRNGISYFNPIAQESTSYTVFSGTPNDSSEQFIAGSKPSGVSSQTHGLPIPYNFNQLTCSRNGELNGRNRNPHVTKSAFGFPFLQPAVNEQAKTYWSQGPYRSLPPCLPSSTDDMLTRTYSQQFSCVGNQSFPQNRWGNNFTTPSPNHSAEFLYPSNPLASRGPVKTVPLCPASIVQPPQVSVTFSAMNSSYRNTNKVVERVKLDDMVVKDHHPYTNIRKRPADNLDDSRKPIQLSNIEVKDNLSRMTRLTGENSNVEWQCNKRTAILDPQVEIARSRCCPNVAQNLNPTSYPAVDSLKPKAVIRSSPVRLGPKRAKHILKSS